MFLEEWLEVLVVELDWEWEEMLILDMIVESVE